MKAVCIERTGGNFLGDNRYRAVEEGKVMPPPANQSQKKVQHILLGWKSIQHPSWPSCSKVKAKSQAGLLLPAEAKTGVWMVFKGAGK